MYELFAIIALAVVLLLGRLVLSWKARKSLEQIQPASSPPPPPTVAPPVVTTVTRSVSAQRRAAAGAESRDGPYDVLLIPTNGHAVTCTMTIGRTAGVHEGVCSLVATKPEGAPWATASSHALHPASRSSAADLMVRHLQLAAFLVEVDPTDGEFVLVSDRDELRQRAVVPQTSIVMSPAQQSVLVHQEAEYRDTKRHEELPSSDQFAKRRGRAPAYYRVGLLLQSHENPANTPLLQRQRPASSSHAAAESVSLTHQRSSGGVTVVGPSPPISKRPISTRAWSPSVIVMFKSRDDRIAFANYLRDFVRKCSDSSRVADDSRVVRRLSTPPVSRSPSKTPEHQHALAPLSAVPPTLMAEKSSPSKHMSRSISPRQTAVSQQHQQLTAAQVELIVASLNAKGFGSTGMRSTFWRDFVVNKFDDMPKLNTGRRTFDVTLSSVHCSDAESQPPAWVENPQLILPATSATNVSPRRTAVPVPTVEFQAAFHHPDAVVLNFVCSAPGSSSVEVAATLTTFVAPETVFGVVPSDTPSSTKPSTIKSIKGLCLHTVNTPATCRIAVSAPSAPAAERHIFDAYVAEIIQRRVIGKLHQNPRATFVNFYYSFDENEAIPVAEPTPSVTKVVVEPKVKPAIASLSLPTPSLDTWQSAAELRLETYTDMKRDLFNASQQRVEEEALYRNKLKCEFDAMQQRSDALHKITQDLHRKKVEQQRKEDEWNRQKLDNEADARLDAVASVSGSVKPLSQSSSTVSNRAPLSEELVGSPASLPQDVAPGSEEADDGRQASMGQPNDDGAQEGPLSIRSDEPVPPAAVATLPEEHVHATVVDQATHPNPGTLSLSPRSPPKADGRHASVLVVRPESIDGRSSLSRESSAAQPEPERSASPAPSRRSIETANKKLSSTSPSQVSQPNTIVQTVQPQSVPPPVTPSALPPKIAVIQPPKEVYTRCESTPVRNLSVLPTANELHESFVHTQDKNDDELLVSASSMHSNTLARSDLLAALTPLPLGKLLQFENQQKLQGGITPAVKLPSESTITFTTPRHTTAPIGTLRPLDISNSTPRPLGNRGSPTARPSPHLEKLRAAREEARGLLQTPTAAVQRPQQPLLSARRSQAVNPALLALECKESSHRAQSDVDMTDALLRLHRTCQQGALRLLTPTPEPQSNPLSALTDGVRLDNVLAMLINDEEIVRRRLCDTEFHKRRQLYADVTSVLDAMLVSQRQHLITSEAQQRAFIASSASDSWVMLWQQHYESVSSRSASRLDATTSDIISQLDAHTPPVSPSSRLGGTFNSTTSSIAQDSRPKPFHYATFAAGDLVHYHTPLMAPGNVDGVSVQHSNVVTEMLRCGVDRELKVVEPILEGCVFLLGDVLLDLNNVALHSHEHLREVLSERAMLVQRQLLHDDPDVEAWTCGDESSAARVMDVTAEQFPMEAVVMRRSDVVVLEVCT
ncbi:GPI-anchored surface protein, putative [Bodo saltans]|uniref:GPI-anchored surface protein, putative n=1 Tax=Bodo saltans TaxID=75058 RepID=A0A0S4JJE5_BODSA|nr:GPI-anchored surface protein, putative [Bodo saltans]|eukprot:CUG91589.1 GPI-anchored surface protein, putative [Bodo saltans]